MSTWLRGFAGRVAESIGARSAKRVIREGPAVADASANGFVPEEWPICCLGQARVSQQGVRCRKAPDVAAAILGVWQQGQVLDVWARLPTWWLVQDRESGLTGWSSAPYLAMVE